MVIGERPKEKKKTIGMRRMDQIALFSLPFLLDTVK